MFELLRLCKAGFIHALAGVFTLGSTIELPNLRNHEQPFDYSIIQLFDYSLVSPFLLRKEVIQPLVPQRLPCYDFIPITTHTLGRQNAGLRVQTAFMM